jgi:16S rRNA (adenine1518-N6/adenine1519-N6)-dimethyltransferase
MRNARSILREYGLKPKKRLGQSFLEDEAVMGRIVAAADIGSADTVVEIGAGLGVMTELIAAQGARVIALEIDPALAGILRERFARRGDQVKVIEGDVLAYDYRSAAEAGRTGKVTVIGNIPYYISTQLLFAVLAARQFLAAAVLMFQEEVAARIVAAPGSKIYGIPSVLTAMYALASHVLTVPPACFYPPPRVHSAVVKILIRPAPLVALADTDFFQRVVRASFAQRRKTIANNLKPWRSAGYTENDIRQALAVGGIDGRRRAETLSAEEFGALSNALIKER